MALWRRRSEFCRKVATVVTEVRTSRRPGFLVLDTRRMGPHSKGDDLRASTSSTAFVTRSAGRLGSAMPAAAREADRGAQSCLRRNRATGCQRVTRATWSMCDAHLHAARRGALASLPRHRGRQQRAPVAQCGAAAPAGNDARTLLIGEDLHDLMVGLQGDAGLSTDFPGRVISTRSARPALPARRSACRWTASCPDGSHVRDFLSLCMDQLFNHGRKISGLFRTWRALVIRTPCGGRRGYGHHSQSPENCSRRCPTHRDYGSHRHNISELLIDAVLRWGYPVLFLEHKCCTAK